ncbi:hypothetical protein [Micromonospora sp. CA-244673]|uniref:hypothetical protein n=1 Tax=Micromonospora sp. CA-244673 TaxID=3239958 RepID=UPI003D8E760B
MSGAEGFFARMAQRATGREPLVRLRAPQPFEVPMPDPPADAPVEAPASWSGSTARTPAPSRGISDRPTAPLGPAALRTTPVPAVPAGPDRFPTDRKPPVTPPEAAPAAADRAAARAAPAGPAGPEPDAASPTTTAPPAVTRARDAEPPPDPGRPAAAVPPAPPAPPPAARRPAPTPVRAAAPDLARLLRERLGPALIARRAVEPGERLVFVDRPVRAGAPPRPGTAEVRTGPIRPAPGSPGTAEDAPPAGDVHLHIDRVVVTRAPAPPPPAPPTPPPSTVDHTAYLARRREGR